MSRPPYTGMPPPWLGGPVPFPSPINGSRPPSPATEVARPSPYIITSSTVGQMLPPPSGAMVLQQLIARQWQAQNQGFIPPFTPWLGHPGAFSPYSTMPPSSTLIEGGGAYHGSMHTAGFPHQHSNFQSAGVVSQPNAPQQAAATPEHPAPTSSGHQPPSSGQHATFSTVDGGTHSDATYQLINSGSSTGERLGNVFRIHMLLLMQ